MTKQISDIITPFHLLSQEEKAVIVDRGRQNKYVLRPTMEKKKAATTSKKKKAAKKKQAKANIKNLVNALSPDQLKALMQSLEKRK